jgi:hypothetical protein
MRLASHVHDEARHARREAHQPSGLSPLLTESLIVMSARSLQPAKPAEAGDALRGM